MDYILSNGFLWGNYLRNLVVENWKTFATHFSTYLDLVYTLRVESEDIPDEGIVPQVHNSKKICCTTTMANILPLPFSSTNKVEKRRNRLLISIPSVDDSYYYNKLKEFFSKKCSGSVCKREKFFQLQLSFTKISSLAKLLRKRLEKKNQLPENSFKIIL